MTKEILSAIQAASYKLEYMTNDRIDAMSGSHGTLNVATMALIDVCVNEILNGADISLTFSNSKSIPLDEVIKKMLKCAKDLNVDKANAALLTALILYMAGTDPRAGVPAGNRKIGAMCRIAAGIPRGGVANIPSPKIGNKISAFPAVMAIYQYLQDNSLSNVQGVNIPFGTFGTLYMHSVLGEDIVLPEIINKATEIAVNALKKSMNGLAMPMYYGQADKITIALLSAAAVLEIIHPDANTQFRDAYYPSAHVVGKLAVQLLGLPPTLTMSLTNQIFDTGVLVGDIGLILKDSGNVSVVGMLALTDMFAVFDEWLVWPSKAPVSTPLANLGKEPWIAMKLLLQNEGKQEQAATILARSREEQFDPELSYLKINLIAHKTLQYHNGPVSNVVCLATESKKVWALSERAFQSYQMLSNGISLTDVVIHFENIRQKRVEKSASHFCSLFFKRNIEIKLCRVEPLGRNAVKGEGIGKFWALDPDADVKVSIDQKEYALNKLCEEWIPKVACQDYDDPDLKIAVESAAVFLQEFSYGGIIILNITVPCCIAATLTDQTIKELSTEAAKAAFLSGGIPGTRIKASRAARVARRFFNDSIQSELVATR